MENNEKLIFTGERYVPELDEYDELSRLHWGRYVFAVDFVKDKTVVDLACGEGYGSDLLASNASKVTGIDIDPISIEHAKKRYRKENLDFFTASATNLSFIDDNSVDVFVSFETIEHLGDSDQNAFIREIKRVLKSDGTLIMSTPDKNLYGAGAREGHFHIKEFTKAEFTNFLKIYFAHQELYGQLKQRRLSTYSLILRTLIKYVVSLDKLRIRHIVPHRLRSWIGKRIFKAASPEKSRSPIRPELLTEDETSQYLVAICSDKKGDE